ncbi:hypothetical protein N7530_011766 [Penicillium desertorum]|uniref:Uncharacterized protein n=1 Tax=Penicillium desertorum TaxID=1303715 RepID=A0A9X0BFY1_9EURO|nr:hypothetical protein N7530_011766 [Penicillium desertorum]
MAIHTKSVMRSTSNPPVLDHRLGRRHTYNPTELAQVKETDLNTFVSLSHRQKRTAYGQLIEAVLILPTFVSTYCLSPLILGRLNEIFGRAAVLPSGDSFYPDLQPGVLGRPK